MKNHLTEDQAQALRETLQGHALKAIITLALLTGMRRSELLALRWQNIDLDQQEIYVPQTKNTGIHQILPISNDSIEMLNHHRLHQMKMQGEAGTLWQHRDLAFPNSTGRDLSPHHFLKEFHEIAKRAALPQHHFHDLRAAGLRKRYTQLRTDKEG